MNGISPNDPGATSAGKHRAGGTGRPMGARPSGKQAKTGGAPHVHAPVKLINRLPLPLVRERKGERAR